MTIFFTILILLSCLVSCDIENITANQSRTRFVIQTSVNLILRSFFNMKSNLKLKSQTYKIILFVLMTFGFIVLSNYKAQLNAALNVYVDNIPFKTWNDIARSDYQILIYANSNYEEKFMNSKDDSILKNIYNEKVKSVPPEMQLQNIKHLEDQVHIIKNGKYMIYSTAADYTHLSDYPCNITLIKSPELL